MTATKKSVHPITAIIGVFLALAFATLAACGDSGDEMVDQVPSDPAGQTQVAEQPTATAEPTALPQETVAPTNIPPSTSAADIPPSTSAADTTLPRQTGEIEGITFVVDEGSEVTFTVGEELANVPLPLDAVIRTTALSGEIHLDGRQSIVEIDLQQLTSDNSFRDRYIRTRMFGEHPTGIFTVDGLNELPDGFTEGEEVSGEISGELSIRGISTPITFVGEARDDGTVIHMVGRTTFTWDQLQISKPTAPVVVSLDEEVRVEVLLSARPK